MESALAERYAEERDHRLRVERQNARLARLQDVTSALVTASTPVAVAETLVREGHDALGATASVVYFGDEITPDQLHLVASRGIETQKLEPMRRLPIGALSPLVTAFNRREPVWIERYEDLVALYPTTRERVVERERLQSAAAIPLLVGDTVLGAAAFSFAEEHAFDQPERQFVLVLIGQCAQALANTRLREGERRARDKAEAQARQAALLADASRAFTAAGPDIERVLATVVERTASVFGDSCALTLVTASGDELMTKAIHHPDPEMAAEQRRLFLGRAVSAREGLRGRVMATAESVLVPVLPVPLEKAGHFEGEQGEFLRRHPVSSLLAVPLFRQGAPCGVMALTRHRPGAPYGEDEKLFLEQLADRASLAIENARLFEAEKKNQATLREAVRARDEFLSIAAHELRTPLTALFLQLDRLYEGKGPRTDGVAVETPWQPKTLEAAVRQTERLGRLIDELLNVSRITSGTLRLEKEHLDFAALTSDVVERMSAEAMRADCALVVRAVRERGPLTVAGDRMRLEQVLTNLLSNALKYGAGKPVEVRLLEEPAHIRLEVRDHGIGIADSDRERIFDRFERAVSNRHYGGLGLGLYVTRQIVEAHGGSIRAETPDDGGGTRFVVTLPR